MDWREEKDYEYTAELSDEGWAWEFLRRNTEYKEDYKRVSSVLLGCNPEYSNLPINITDKFKFPEEWFFFDPPKKTGETSKEWWRRILDEGLEPHCLTLELGYAKKWYLRNQMFNPAIRYNEDIEFRKASELPKVVSWDECGDYFESDDYFEASKVDKALIVFDMKRPLTPQIEIAKKLLKERQGKYKQSGKAKIHNKLYRSNWLVYLRAIDAYKKATNAEIAKVLCPIEHSQDPKAASDKIRDTVIQARKMSADRYKVILLNLP